MDEMKRKAQFFFEGESQIHVRTKSAFYNGFIIKIVRDEYFIINDRKFGDTPVYFSEIIKLERFVEEDKKCSGQ